MAKGFVTFDEVFHRFASYRTSASVWFELRKLPGSDFCEVGVLDKGTEPVHVFDIYMGTVHSFSYVRDVVVNAAKALGHECICDKWENEDVDD